ncbi:CMP-N-acetylneuraminic acid synthetase [Roseivirga seohaensis]|uniref:CMP-N-acetylneuraminic acid synthetase n=1 Tax=Roseivirga seohaensis TaxID=1914963 RepID=A0A150XMK2_9BACT|nr:acylneuraminate cytidylyltransferase family protein [Roseivirga seohaensis]KYG79875.1 CMP-N-acetylneuraminic acid synthetase [Roseivirga seohaensis]
MKPLVIIPARGGSKGVPGKNIKPLNGKPLINYTVEAARAVFPDEHICVSTDSFEIKSVVEKTGLPVPFIRPAELATDTAGTYGALLHAMEFYEKKGYTPDTIILLQPTSPFRSASHIQGAIDLFDAVCDMVVSVRETNANPYYVLKEENEAGWLEKSKPGNYTRRQDCPKVYEVNGAIYVMHAAVLKEKPIGKFQKVRKYLMDEHSSMDIDTRLDWQLAEFVLNSKED